MKKKLIMWAALILVIALATGVIGGCGGSDSSTKFTVIFTEEASDNAEGEETSEIETTTPYPYEANDEDKCIYLSRTGQNVIILMLDRAIGAYIPFLFDEDKSLYDSFSGFTFYPNTVSFAGHTNYCVPALFGGYEYTPEAMDSRSDELIPDQHDEALKVLPTLFGNEGYNVTVLDPPFAGYSEVPDLSIYDGLENVTANNYIYYPDYYTCYDMSLGAELFQNAFDALSTLSETTQVKNYTENCLVVMQNEITHWPRFFDETYTEQTGDYCREDFSRESRTIDGVTMSLSGDNEAKHYMLNMATWKQVAKYMDWLKEQGVYDNTRIIITADHGYSLYQFDSMWFSTGFDAMYFNPVLMVKDFNAEGTLVTDKTFMTIADVPTLATEGLIDNPVNPYTGNPINSDAKEDGVRVTTAHGYYIYTNMGYTFDVSDGSWYRIKGNIANESDWKYDE